VLVARCRCFACWVDSRFVRVVWCCFGGVLVVVRGVCVVHDVFVFGVGVFLFGVEMSIL